MLECYGMENFGSCLCTDVEFRSNFYFTVLLPGVASITLQFLYGEQQQKKDFYGEMFKTPANTFQPNDGRIMYFIQALSHARHMGCVRLRVFYTAIKVAHCMWVCSSHKHLMRLGFWTKSLAAVCESFYLLCCSYLIWIDNYLCVAACFMHRRETK